MRSIRSGNEASVNFISSFISSTIQKYQQCAKEALQKVEQLTTSKQQVEAHLTRLQEVHQTYKNDRACLLTCASLLAGSLFPALERIQQLMLEKSLLLKQISSHKNLQMKVCELVTLIQADIGDSSPTENGKNKTPHFVSLSEYTYHPLLRFRKLVIVVLAVNRLLRLCAESTMTFSLRGTEGRNLNPNLRVCVGTRDGTVPSRKKRGVVRPSPRCANKDLVGWLRSETMLIEVRESFTELQSTLDACTVLHHLHQPKGGRKEKTLPNHTQRRPDLETSAVAPTKASFAVLLEKVASHFPFTPHSPPPPPSHVTLLTPLGSLWSRLGEGLTVVLLRAGHPHLGGHATCSKVRKTCSMSDVSSHIRSGFETLYSWTSIMDGVASYSGSSPANPVFLQGKSLSTRLGRGSYMVPRYMGIYRCVCEVHMSPT